MSPPMVLRVRLPIRRNVIADVRRAQSNVKVALNIFAAIKDGPVNLKIRARKRGNPGGQ